MLPNWKTQHRSRRRQSKLKLSHIMAELSAFHEFEFFEVFRVQTTYKHQLMHKLINIHLLSPILDLSITQTCKITNQCQTQISESKKKKLKTRQGMDKPNINVGLQSEKSNQTQNQVHPK